MRVTKHTYTQGWSATCESDTFSARTYIVYIAQVNINNIKKKLRIISKVMQE